MREAVCAVGFRHLSSDFGTSLWSFAFRMSSDACFSGAPKAIDFGEAESFVIPRQTPVGQVPATPALVGIPGQHAVSGVTSGLIVGGGVGVAVPRAPIRPVRPGPRNRDARKPGASKIVDTPGAGGRDAGHPESAGWRTIHASDGPGGPLGSAHGGFGEPDYDELPVGKRSSSRVLNCHRQTSRYIFVNRM